MELVSTTEVTVVPRQVFWGKSEMSQVSGQYYNVSLKPGEGIVIPSNFLHTVHHLHIDRLGVLAESQTRLQVCGFLLKDLPVLF